MENRAHALAAGVFALLLVAAGLVAIWWFGGKHEATRDYLVVTPYNVTGLNLQAQVRYRGIRVGKVEDIHLSKEEPGNILIRIRINEEVPVTKGTAAKLGYQGVTGLAFVLLEDEGEDRTPLTARQGTLPRIAMEQSLIQEMSDVGADAMRQARELLDDANNLFSEQNQKRVNNTLANLEAISANLKPATQELPQTLAQVRKVLSDDNLQRLSVALEGAAQASREVPPALAEARQLLGSLHRLSERLDQGAASSSDGSLGVLSPRWSELAAELGNTSRQLNRVLQQLEQSPQSLIFGAQPLPPGPGETGFAAPASSAGAAATAAATSTRQSAAASRP